MKNYLLKLLCLLIVVLCSCKKDKVSITNQIQNADCPNIISYSQQIQPLLNQSCATSYCHGGGSNGYDLSNHTSVSDNASIILSVIKHESGFEPMPFGSPKLPDSVINHFQCWIDQGKQNN